jgi:hypothetical protein
MFAMTPPLAAAELLWIRALGQECLKHLRPNLMVELVKVDQQSAPVRVKAAR